MLDSSIGRYKTVLQEKREVIKYFWIKQSLIKETPSCLCFFVAGVSVYHLRLYSTQNVLGAGLMAYHFLLQSRPCLVLRKKDVWADWRIRNRCRGAKGTPLCGESRNHLKTLKGKRNSSKEKETPGLRDTAEARQLPESVAFWWPVH